MDYTLNYRQKAGREFSRSLYIAKDVKVGDIVTEENVRSVRPGYGLHPKYLNEIVGRVFKREFTVGDRLDLEALE